MDSLKSVKIAPYERLYTILNKCNYCGQRIWRHMEISQ